MIVQHNLQAMNANRMLGLTTKTVAGSTEKLSSGYKINRAADDAAGLAISEKMRKQIRGLSQAATNSEDGVSCVQTAEGALAEVQDMLQRMNELCVQAANGTNSKTDRQYIQDEIDQLISEIDRVAETTKFNETYLLKGSNIEETSKVYVHNYSLTYTKNIVNNSDKNATALENKVNYVGKNNLIITSTEVLSSDSSNAVSAKVIGDGDDITDFMVKFDDEPYSLVTTTTTVTKYAAKYVTTEKLYDTDDKTTAKAVPEDYLLGYYVFGADSKYTYNSVANPLYRKLPDDSFIAVSNDDVKDYVSIEEDTATTSNTEKQAYGISQDEVDSGLTNTSSATTKSTITLKTVEKEKYAKYVSKPVETLKIVNLSTTSASSGLYKEGEKDALSFEELLSLIDRDENGKLYFKEKLYKDAKTFEPSGAPDPGSQTVPVAFDKFADKDKYRYVAAENQSGSASNVGLYKKVGSDYYLVNENDLKNFVTQGKYGTTYPDSYYDATIASNKLYVAIIKADNTLTFTDVQNDAITKYMEYGDNVDVIVDRKTVNMNATTARASLGTLASNQIAIVNQIDNYEKVEQSATIQRFEVDAKCPNSCDAEFDTSKNVAFVAVALNSSVATGANGKVNGNTIYDLSTNGMTDIVRANKDLFVFNRETKTVTRIPIGGDMSDYLDDNNSIADGYQLVDIVDSVDGTSAKVKAQYSEGEDFIWSDDLLQFDMSRRKLYDAKGKEVSGMALNNYFDDKGNYKGGLFAAKTATVLDEVHGSEDEKGYIAGMSTLISEYITQTFSDVAKNLDLEIQSGSDSERTNKITMKLDSLTAAGLGIDKLSSKKVGIVDETGNNATDAIDVVAAAIQKISEQRAGLGAIQNRLEHTIRNLDNIVENTTAAEAQIRDTDMAEEMVKYANANILQQAGQSMLAQANQSNQGVLTLLQ